MSRDARVKVRVYGSAGAQSSPLLRAVDDLIAGQAWLPRLPLLLYCIYLFWRCNRDPFYFGLIGGLNLGIHEFGHYAFAFGGEFAAILGGSLTQCLVPVIGMLMFLRQRDLFAIAFAFCWLGSNFYNVGTYAADALVQQLDLVSPSSGDPIHDWNYILTRWGMLNQADLVGRMFRAAGFVSFTVGIVGGAWLLWRMRASSRNRIVNA